MAANPGQRCNDRWELPVSLPDTVEDARRAEDVALVRRAQTGDSDAFAELYRLYFDQVYDFLARMLRNRTDAEDVAQDAFVRAMNGLGGLQDATRFRAWLFTIARNQALNRIERGRRTRPLAFETEDGDVTELDLIDPDRFSDPQEANRAAETAALVWEAAAGLNAKQYSLLDMHLRQGLDSAEIADALGVTRNNGYVMLNRLKSAIEGSIGAYVMMQTGRAACMQLDAELSAAGATGITPQTRRLVERHVEQCADCQRTQAGLVSPLTILGGFAPLPAAPAFKEALLGDLMREWPGVPGTEARNPGTNSPAALTSPIAAVPAAGGRSLVPTIASAAGLLAGVALLVLALLADPFSGSAAGETSVRIAFHTADGEPVGGVAVQITQALEGVDTAVVVGATSDAAGTILIEPPLLYPSAGRYQLEITDLPDGYEQAQIGALEPFEVREGEAVTVTGVFAAD